MLSRGARVLGGLEALSMEILGSVDSWVEAEAAIVVLFDCEEEYPRGPACGDWLYDRTGCEGEG